MLRRLSAQCGVHLSSSTYRTGKHTYAPEPFTPFHCPERLRSFRSRNSLFRITIGTSYLSAHYKSKITWKPSEDVILTGHQLWEKCKGSCKRGKTGKLLDFRSAIDWGQSHPIFTDPRRANRQTAVDFSRRSDGKHFIAPHMLKAYDPRFMPSPAPFSLVCKVNSF